MNASGASTKGNTTPSGGKKGLDPLKKSKTLKRPGSPNLSDSSGNESSRKKKVKTAKNSSLGPSRSTTPLPGRLRAGATSDGEGTAGEGSDAGQKKKIKIKTGGTATGTPAGSRAGSPVPSGKIHPRYPITHPHARAHAGFEAYAATFEMHIADRPLL